MTRETELEAVRRQLAEANATLDAIRTGQVDAVLVAQGDGHEVYTLESADLPYREFIEQMDEGALSLDQSQTILYSNRYFAELVEVPRSEIVGQLFPAWLAPDSRRLFEVVISSGQVRQVAVTLISSSGNTVPVRLGIVPQGARGNRQTIAVISDQSIAERLQHEIEARDVAEAESSAKDRFLAVLGHELRNPIAALASSVDLLRHGTVDVDGSRRLYAGMSRQLFQLQSLLDDLLDLSRVVHGKISLNRTSISVAEVLANSREAVASLVESKRHQLVMNDVTEGLCIFADRTRIEQVLVNLLSNAARYTPDGGCISVSAKSSGEWVVVEVADSGIGIDSTGREAIFEPFVQLGEAGTGGLGIGLTLVKQLVELHDGAIEAESPGPDQGTTFRLRLPPSEAPPVSTAAPNSAMQAGLWTDSPILVVDDNAEAAELMTMLLETMGCKVATAYSGNEALLYVRGQLPGLIFLDLGLPDLSGYEVAKQLKAEHPHIHVIALTGFSHAEANAKVKEAGFDAHLIKPLRMIELQQVLSRFRQLARH